MSGDTENRKRIMTSEEIKSEIKILDEIEAKLEADLAGIKTKTDRSISFYRERFEKEKNKDRRRVFYLAHQMAGSQKSTAELMLGMMKEILDMKKMLFYFSGTLGFLVEMAGDSTDVLEAKDKLDEFLGKYGESSEGMRQIWEKMKEANQNNEPQEETKGEKNIYG